MSAWTEYFARFKTAPRFDCPVDFLQVEQTAQPDEPTREEETPEWLLVEAERVRMEGRIESNAENYFDLIIGRYGAKKQRQETPDFRFHSFKLATNMAQYLNASIEEKRPSRAAISKACRGKESYTNVPGGIRYCGFRKPGYKECPARSNIPFPLQAEGLSGILVGGSEYTCNCKH